MIKKVKGHIPLALVKRLDLKDCDLKGIQTPQGDLVSSAATPLPSGSFVAVVVF